MPYSFEVDPDALRGLADRLDGAYQELNNTGTVISGYHGRLGATELDDQLDSFFNDWSNGMNLIETRVSELVNRLRGAADGYGQTDAAIAKGATPDGAAQQQ